MARRKKPETLQQLAATHVGQIKGAKVVAFIVMWAIAEEALGHPPTLDEYADCAAAIAAATTPAGLEAATAPVAHEPPTPVPTPGRTLIGVFGGTDQRGRWRLPRRLRILAVFGGVSADLGAAQVEAPLSTISVLAIFGGVSLTAPPGLSVQLSGASLLGGKSDKRPAGPPLPGSPVIHVRAYTLLGGVSIERPKRRDDTAG